MKTYEIDFIPAALREWNKLDASTRNQLKKKLAERLTHPHVPASRLSGWPNCYRLKLRKAGYRLIYEVMDEIVTVLVIAVGRRDGNEVYDDADDRLKQLHD